MSIDREVPLVPITIHNGSLIEQRCLELWDDICAEITDPTYSGRSHNSGTYEQGCRGPVCKKANREHYRRKAPGGVLAHSQDDRIYDPVIEYFHTVIKYRIHAAQQEILKELKGAK